MSAQLQKNVCEVLDFAQKNGVKLVAVTKTVPVEIINEAISYGVKAIGENRVQELMEKYDRLNKSDLEIHLIGSLQSNKAKYIVGKVDLIHSVDNFKLANTINKLAVDRNIIQDILVQVNISGESTKSGIEPSFLTDFLIQLSELTNIRVRGLMCIPAPETYEGENEECFKAMNKMLVDNNAKKLDNISMDILSMGMSSDYTTATNCGATHIRVGSKIFGKRNYQEV